MEKDFFPSPQSPETWTPEDDPVACAVKKIPTPEVVPEPPNLGSIPRDILQSGVVESLISQNDDLMARLRVQIRRCHSYEAKMAQTRQECDRFENLYLSSKDQITLWREKEVKWSEKLKASYRELKELKSEHEWLELRYAELDESVEGQRQRAETEKDELKRKIQRGQTYRLRLRPLLLKLRKEHRKLQSHISRIQKQHEDNLLASEQEICKKSEEVEALTCRLSEMQHLFEDSRNASGIEIDRLTQHQEQETLQLKSEIEHLNALLAKLKFKLRDHDQVVEKSAVLQNKIIQLQRKRQLADQRQLVEMEKISSENAKLKARVLELEDQLSTHSEES